MTKNPLPQNPEISNTPSEVLTDIFQQQKDFFHSHATRPVAFRKKQLKKLRALIVEYEEDILEALQRDFGKPRFEAYASEIGFMLEEIKVALKNVGEWAERRKKSSPLSTFPSKSYVQPEPKGVVLIIGPWNYPFQLVLSPLVAAMAAGNTAVVKPPEQTPHTSKLIERMLHDNFERGYLAVVQGQGHEVVPQLMKNHRFDHVLFTGSTAVGRKIAELAAPNLVPTTLELGGKSPAIIDSSAKLKTAAYRVAFGKWLNAGQTCVAPDYLLIERSVKDDFLEELQNTVEKFYPKGALQSDDYTAMIHQDHFDKVRSYLDQGNILFGGNVDEQARKIAPTILTEVSFEDKVMQEEIFGPVLPVLTYGKPSEAVEMINRNPRPLALYLFAEDKNMEEMFLQNLQFGGGAVNNTVVHLSNPKLPFGGIGTSGYGNYHGVHGFRTFSHFKSIMKTGTWFDLQAKYPPYSTFAYKLIKKIMK